MLCKVPTCHWWAEVGVWPVVLTSSVIAYAVTRLPQLCTLGRLGLGVLPRESPQCRLFGCGGAAAAHNTVSLNYYHDGTGKRHICQRPQVVRTSSAPMPPRIHRTNIVHG